MARKKSLPLIEDFDNIPNEALVPLAEQPYPIPSHWKWVYLDCLATYIQRGRGPKYSSSGAALAISQKCVRWEGLDISQARGWEQESFDALPDIRILQDGDILWNSTGTGTIGRVVMIPFGFTDTTPKIAADSHVTVIRTTPAIKPEFLTYFLSSETVQYKLEERLAAGTTNQKELNLGTIRRVPIPLAPPDEQERIVEHLEEHLQKIDDVIGKLEDFLDSSKTREANLLKLAFHGKLTDPISTIDDDSIESADEQPYPLPSHWKWVQVATLNDFRSHSLNPAKHEHETFELYSVPAYADGNPEYPKGQDIGSTKQRVLPGDVLISKINPRINRVWLVSPLGKHRQIASSEWIVFRTSYGIPAYFQHYFRSPFFRELLTSQVSGVGGSLTRAQPKTVATYPIPLPPLEEQEKIVDTLSEQLERIAASENMVREALASLQESRKSLISAALAGHLVA